MEAVIVSITAAPLMAYENPANALIGSNAIVHITRPETNRTIRVSYCFTKKYTVAIRMTVPINSNTTIASLSLFSFFYN